MQHLFLVSIMAYYWYGFKLFWFSSGYDATPLAKHEYPTTAKE